MKHFIFTISLLLILSSCIDGSNLKSIFPTHHLDGGNAKIWVLEKSSLENDEAFTLSEDYRKSLIFFSNNTFREQEYIHLGSRQGEFGKYHITQDNQGFYTIKITYISHADTLYFEVVYIDNKTLILKNYETSVIWEFRSLKPPL